MTEESPIQDPSTYQFPEKHFQRLYELEDNSPQYSIVQGSLYDNLRSDSRFSATDAMDVSRHLNNGEVEDAETLVDNVLTEEE